MACVTACGWPAGCVLNLASERGEQGCPAKCQQEPGPRGGSVDYETFPLSSAPTWTPHPSTGRSPLRPSNHSCKQSLYTNCPIGTGIKAAPPRASPGRHSGVPEADGGTGGWAWRRLRAALRVILVGLAPKVIPPSITSRLSAGRTSLLNQILAEMTLDLEE